MDKADSYGSMNMKNQFSNNFRSGLKFPSLGNRNHVDDSGFVATCGGGEAGAGGLSKIIGGGGGALGLGRKGMVEQKSSDDHSLGRNLLQSGYSDDTKSQVKRNSMGKLVGIGNKPPEKKTLSGKIIDEDAGGDRLSMSVHGKSASELTLSSQDLSSDSYAQGDQKTIPAMKVCKSGKSKDIDTEINQRISSVYRSIETLAKKRINFDNSIRAASRRTFADGAKNKNILAALSSTDYNGTDKERTVRSKKSSGIIDVTRTYPKMFGLDPMKVIASSEDDSDMEDNPEQRDPRKKTKKSIRKYLEQLIKDEQPRDMSAIMPTMSEKTFLTKLQKRESQLNKEINDMRNSLDVMNMKAEREANKAQAEGKKHQKLARAAKVTRLIAADADKGPARELTDFLQSTGGSTGGWEPSDHQVFMRGFKKWSHLPAKLIENMIKLLPNKRPEDIVEHRNWHEKYEKLNNANKEHIRQWQMSKKRERELAYRMAHESQNSRKEAERRQQEMVRTRRNSERERNKELLEQWKRSKTFARRTTNNGEVHEIDNNQRLAQMNLEMSSIKKEIQEISSMTRDIGKNLQTVRSTESSAVAGQKKNDRARTAVSDASSGFCEMTMDEIEAVGNELEGEGEKFLRSRSRGTTAPNQTLGVYKSNQRYQTAETKKLLLDYRTRDTELIEAKKKAILGRKEKMRNRAFLTDQQVKERMKKISTPSKYMSPTKGWMIRREMKELEKTEALHKHDPDTYANSLEKDNITPVFHVSNIPKLGIPTWRKSAA